jgi:hypothetical protein
MISRPLARSADLIVDNIGDELLVYDTLSNRAHSLNNVSAAVWQACDGTRNAEEIAAQTGLDLAAVELALDNLADIELISGHQRTGISRRTALRRITVGAAGLAVALPVIRSITAPTAAMAGSGGKTGNTCVSNDNSKGSCSPASISHCSYNSYCVAGPVVPNSSSCQSGPQCGFFSLCLGGFCAQP